MVPHRVADALTDVAAAVLLLAGLLAPWARGDRGVNHLEVLALTGVAVLSLTARHLAAAGHAPPTWTVRGPMRVRLLAGGAYAAFAVLHLVRAGGVWPHDPSLWLGNDAALGLGLAGAVLVARPRRTELAVLGEDPATVRLWRGIAAVVVGGCVLLLLAGSATGGAAMTADVTLRFRILDVYLGLSSALTILALTVPLLGLVVGGAAWRPAVIAVGASLTGATALAAFVPGPAVVLLQGAGNSLCLLPAAAIAAGSLVTERDLGTRPVETDDPARWDAAVRLCGVVAAVAVLGTGIIVWEMFTSRLVRGPGGAVVVIAALLLAVAAVVLRQVLLDGGSTARVRTVMAAGVVLLGSLTLAADQATQAVGITTLAVAGDLGLPIALLVVVLSARRRPGEEAGPVASEAWTTTTT